MTDNCPHCEELEASLAEAEFTGVAESIENRRQALEIHQARHHANE